MKKQSESSRRDITKKASAADRKHTREGNAQFAAFIRDLRVQMGCKTQLQFADKLGVERSAVGAWESARGYRPSAETLLKIANLAPYPLSIQAWNEAGVDFQKLWRESSNALIEGAAKSGLLKVPLLELPDPFDHEERALLVGPPLSTAVDVSHVACARIGAPAGLFPFSNGQVAIIDRSKTDWWESIESGSLVAVYLDRHPEVLGWDQQMETRTLATYRSEPPVVGRPEEGETEFPPHLVPDSDAMIGLQAIYVGWIALDRPNDPGFQILGDQGRWRALPAAADPWRVVLTGAEVKGVHGGGLVQVTNWETERAWRDRPRLSLKHVRLLGTVTGLLTYPLDDKEREP